MPPNPSPFPPPDFDLTHAYPDLAALRGAVVARDWPSISAFFDRLPDADRRNVAVRTAAEVDGADQWFAELVAANPDSSLIRVLYAASLIEAGWAVRSSYSAKYVSREQFKVFHDYLRRSEQLLIDITAREPDNVLAWALRQITALGLELGQAEARRRYDHVARYAPHCFFAQSRMLQQLCPKWSGDFDKAYAFARECAEAAPDGAINAALVADYYLERWLDFGDKAEAAAFLRRPEVQQEIRRAGGRSVLHPAHERGYKWYWAHNLFAALFSLAGDYAAAAVHFRAVGPYGDRFVWGYLGEPTRNFVEHRDRALGTGVTR
ncbi:MAG TPA: hypothetical protein VF054_16700 [Micromonosporaceae bacterium]